MPLVKKSSYPGPPVFQFNGHLQTIVPALRSGARVNYVRERIETKDADFLDLDWVKKGSKNLVILTHGLEGNSSRSYMRNTSRWFSDRNWDVIAWNCRSCSGEINRAKRLYSHGEIEDIGEVIAHALEVGDYKNIGLVGFSMGGNVTLKYLGANGKNVPQEVKAGVAFSAPSDLKASTVRVEMWDNFLYNKRFLHSLKGKMRQKSEMYPDLVDIKNFDKVNNWDDFMRYFYAPLHDCASVEEFYEYASSRNFVAGTDRPALLVNALNDSLLTPECSPVEIAESHPKFYLENPVQGGHCGFALSGEVHSWAEKRAWEFLEKWVE